MLKIPHVSVIGAGLAGCEVAFQLANANIPVLLYEMKPHKYSPAHISNNFSELVCSNSLRSNSLNSAIGLLHEELRALGSLCLHSAYTNRVPAGDALAVDRENFSKTITNTIKKHPNITVINEEITQIPMENIVVIATGPLTTEGLSNSIIELIGEKSLNFFDAIAPIVHKDSIDFSKAWWQSRYNKTGNDYINCGLTEEEYNTFYNALITADSIDAKNWEQDIPFFEGCLPIEVMANRGKQTLLFGCMKPVGLLNPHTQEQPFAALQLRQDNNYGTLYNIVGFQTRLKYAEQKKVLRLIPALKNAEFAKLGSIHKNTFINSPRVLNGNLSLKNNSNIFFAGQITGCEGYCESIAMGFLCALFIKQQIFKATFTLPKISALHAILNHVINSENSNFQPSNINFGLFPNLDLSNSVVANSKKIPKKVKREKICELALQNLVILQEDLLNKKLITKQPTT